MMELEGEYVGLLLAVATYHADVLSGYSPDVLRRAVNWGRESLVMEELESIQLFGRRFRSEDIVSVAEAGLSLLRMRLCYNSWRWHEMYPNLNLEEDINIDDKISRLKEMVNLREKYLKLENVYFWVLQERHTNNHANTHTSFDIHQIHLEYLWENVLQTSVRWRNDWRLWLDAYTRSRQKSFGNDVLEKMEELKKSEREYYEFIEMRHLTNLDSISLKNVTQIYAKYNHPEVLDEIDSLRVKVKNLESEWYGMLQNITHRPPEEHAYKDLVKARKELQVIEDVYFKRLKHNIAEKNFLQPPPTTKAYESFNIGEEEEFLQILYDSIKLYKICCFNCHNCINNMIQSALKLEDVALKLEDVEELSVNIEDVPENCYEVIYKFLNLRILRCPTCMNCVSYVTIQNDRKQSKTPVQTSTTSICGRAGEAISHQPDLAIINSPPHEQSTRARRWEIRGLVVLGGLMESITSLVIVTAAMSANISDGNIVALALTNLIAGLFIIRHDVSRLQKKSRIKKKFNRIEVDGNSFKEVLKEKMYCVLCFIIAYLSFLFFGLVPPLVYALSSLKIRNKNLKITAAAGASLSCTAFLAVLKAHIIQKPRNRLVYVKTAAIYVSVGVVAFGISYLAGYMFGQVAEKLPWDL